MDYVLLSALKGFNLRRLILSYDIACQYHKNLRSRISGFQNDLKLDLDNVDLEVIIPKFHIVGHGENCQTRYSFNFREHMGRTDGENIERGWAAFNGTATSLREMGPGSRHDSLNFTFASWNWQRIILLGEINNKNVNIHY